MWKRSMVVISGAVLAVSLPTAAFALVTEGSEAPVKADTQVAVQIQEEVQTQIQDEDQVQSQVMDRKQLRLHVETGPPVGTEPTQTRLREHQEMGMANPDAPMGNQDALRGNPDAPMLGDGTGECIHDGDPIGTGPHGPGGGSNG
ncbi:MAG: hypothetical protein M3112_04095 [Actinomycetia bacterium]|nr:hypothetical protein [Actinomycetes bacterium]